MENGKEIKIPFLRCLRCFEDMEKWAALVEGLNQIQKKSGGESLQLPPGTFDMQTVINAPLAAEEAEIATLKELSQNSDIKGKVK